MKAKIKPLIILIALFVLSLAAAITVGCSIGEKTAQDLAGEMGLNCPVTYYANGGQFVDGTSKDQKVYRTVYYKPETPIFNIGVDSSTGQAMTISRDGYVFMGWEYCKLNEEGEPILKDTEGVVLNVLDNGTADIKDVNGRQLLEQNKRFTAEPDGTKAFADGKIVIHEGDHIYLAATWVQDVVLEYRLVTDTPISATVTENGESKTATCNTGDLIAKQVFTLNEIYLDTSFSPVTDETLSDRAILADTHTYIHLYYDEECKEPVLENGVIDKPADSKNAVIYVKYLQGSWTTVRTAANFASMLSSSTAGNYYIPFDIDCASYASFGLRNSTATFNSKVEGNGFTVSNIKITSRLPGNNNVSLFGTLGANAQINNLTLQTVTADISFRTGNLTIYALFSGVNEGATLKGFKVVDYTLSISGASNGTILNIQKDNAGVYITDNWLYGTGTDAEFISKYGNIVQNATLKIDNEQVTQVTGGQQ